MVTVTVVPVFMEVGRIFCVCVCWILKYINIETMVSLSILVISVDPDILVNNRLRS